MKLHGGCCLTHGCRYSEPDCPVALGTMKPDRPCRKCIELESPTKYDYEAAVTALWKYRDAEEKLTAANKVLEKANASLRKKIRAIRKRLKRQMAARA